MTRRAAALLMLLALPGCSYVPSWAGGDPDPVPVAANAKDRKAILPAETQVTPDPSFVQQNVVLPAPVKNPAWPSHMAPGVEHLALPPQIAERTSATIGEGEDFQYRLVVTPVVANGMIYAMDAEGNLSAHDAKNPGSVKWRTKGVKSQQDDLTFGGGLSYDNGRLFVTSGRGVTVAINAATGVELWRQALNIPVRSAPRAAGGYVYVVAVDSQLIALDAKSGAVVWTHRGISEGTGYLIEPSPTAAAGFVLAPYASGEVYALRVADGSVAWSEMVMGPSRQSGTSIFTGIGGDPVVKDGVAYIAGSAGMFTAIKLETGQRIWEQPLSSVNTPWVAGDMVFLLTADSKLVALSRMDGRVRYVSALPEFENEKKQLRYSWSGPVLAGGKLYIAGAHGVMLAVEPGSGKIVSEINIPDGVYTAPIIADGVMYLVAEDAAVHLLY